MTRRTKTSDEIESYERVGGVLAKLRKDRGWTLKYVAGKLNRSIAALSAMEGGQSTVSIAMLEKAATLFHVPVTMFFSADPSQDTLSAEWTKLYDVLPSRDRLVLIDLAKRLVSWPRTIEHRHAALPPRKAGAVVSLEGIDGHHLDTLAARLVKKSPEKIAYVPHNYQSHLWRHMIRYSSKLDRRRVESRAFERTLLYSCERLGRYRDRVEPELRQGKIVLVPFLAMASSVYQETEGVGDRRILDIVETFVPRPDGIVVLRSDVAAAGRKAVPRVPASGQFYSPYRAEQLAAAAALHEKAIEEFIARGCPVHVFDAPDPLPGTTVEAVYDQIVRKRRG